MPPTHVVTASKLSPRHPENDMMKYTDDDTYIMVGSAMVHTVSEEFDKIKSWGTKITSKFIQIKLKKLYSLAVVMIVPNALLTLHFWTQAGRCPAGAQSHPDPATCDGSSS